MRNFSLILLLAVGASNMLFAQSGVSRSVTLRWDDTEYKIDYSINGRDYVLKGKHGVPSEHGILPNGPRPARKASDVITAENMNYGLLDSLCWKECNKYRRSLNLPPLRWDAEINTAASNHSYYMAYFSDLVHDEDRKIEGREAEQAHYKDIFRGAAEICLYNHAYLGSSTYQEVAEYCIDQWRNSPGHNAIMISKSYKYTGFGARLQSSEGSRLNEERLLEYNPRLHAELKEKVPEVFDMDEYDGHVVVWCSANMTWGDPEVESVASRKRGGTAERVVAGERPDDTPTLNTGAGSNTMVAANTNTDTRTGHDRTTRPTGSNANAGENRLHKTQNTRKAPSKNDFGARFKDSWRRKMSTYKRKKRARKNRRKYKRRRRR